MYCRFSSDKCETFCRKWPLEMFARVPTPQFMSLNLNKEKNIKQMNDTVDIECEVEYILYIYLPSKHGNVVAVRILGYDIPRGTADQQNVSKDSKK